MLQVLSTMQYGHKFDKIDTFTNNHVLHVYDVFDQVYLNRILSKGNPKYVVSDHYTSTNFDHSSILICLPVWLEKQTRQLCADIDFADEISTVNCFNFMINKKQINRFLCIKLVEWFKLSDFDYTWSGIDNNFDMTTILHELDQLGEKTPLDSNTRSFLLSPISLQKKFIDFNTNIVSKHTSRWDITGTQFRSLTGGVGWSWNNGLNKMFSHSAISLITESVQYEQASLFTEKTLFSVLGLTFPIWVGGYNQAHEWARLGLDTFDDVIDHSYQSYGTLIERCYFAFEKNIKILSNKTLAQQLRQKHQHRLIKNRNFLLQNGLAKSIDNQIATLPYDLKQVMPDILRYFRRSNP
jgi:hypothetical protein